MRVSRPVLIVAASNQTMGDVVSNTHQPSDERTPYLSLGVWCFLGFATIAGWASGFLFLQQPQGQGTMDKYTRVQRASAKIGHPFFSYQSFNQAALQWLIEKYGDFHIEYHYGQGWSISTCCRQHEGWKDWLDSYDGDLTTLLAQMIEIAHKDPTHETEPLLYKTLIQQYEEELGEYADVKQMIADIAQVWQIEKTSPLETLLRIGQKMGGLGEYRK